MKIVYMGTPEFACAPLKHLHQSRHEIMAVVTGPDKPSGRGKKLTPTPVAALAAEYSLPVLKPETLKSDKLFAALAEYRPDLIVIIAFRILPERLYSLPRLGAINIHASLLPRYRGAAPINWALINGETETGLTSFYLKSKVDTGDIILQEKTPIEETDNFDSLYNHLSQLAGPFLVKTLEQIEQGRAEPIGQNDTLATPAPKISPFDAMIDFGFPAHKVRNFIRGLATKPGAYTFLDGKKLKILACRVSEESGNTGVRPGTIVKARKKLIVQCANSAIEITSLVPQGKRRMDGPSFINGFKPQPEAILGEVPDGGRTD